MNGFGENVFLITAQGNGLTCRRNRRQAFINPFQFSDATQTGLRTEAVKQELFRRVSTRNNAKNG